MSLAVPHCSIAMKLSSANDAQSKSGSIKRTSKMVCFIFYSVFTCHRICFLHTSTLKLNSVPDSRHQTQLALYTITSRSYHVLTP